MQCFMHDAPAYTSNHLFALRQRGQRACEVSTRAAFVASCYGADTLCLPGMPKISFRVATPPPLSPPPLLPLPPRPLCLPRWYYRAGLLFWPSSKRLVNTVQADPARQVLRLHGMLVRWWERADSTGLWLGNQVAR